MDRSHLSLSIIDPQPSTAAEVAEQNKPPIGITLVLSRSIPLLVSSKIKLVTEILAPHYTTLGENR